MAGTSGLTLNKPSYNSSTPTNLRWRTFTTKGGWYADLNGAEGSKVIFLVAAESTAVSAGTTIYVGTSATADTRSAAAALYSGAGLNRMKLKVAKTTKASSYARFHATGSTKLMHIAVLGPFETARFKDSDGYLNIVKAKTGSTKACIAAILLP